MTIRLSPILKYQLAIDIHVISTVGGAAWTGAAHAIASAAAARRMAGMRAPSLRIRCR
jgi:hypothetical protein